MEMAETMGGKVAFPRLNAETQRPRRDVLAGLAMRACMKVVGQC